MASKQLGRLRQWAGEVISSREKTTVHEEFRDLEKDIELRKDGVHRLLVASEGYYHILSKKKASDSLTEKEKLLPIDTLGLVMIGHGEEFGPDSSFGRALVKLGRAHCKVATLQEAYALTLKDTFLASMDQFKEDIKEYEVLRKKLDSKKLTYDAAVTKHEKVLNNKKEKEKDKREAEDELDRAKQQYDEMSEDLRAHMHAIQENEHNQLEELTSFLALETNFVQSYLAVLNDVKEGWQGGINIKKNDTPKSKRPSIQIPQLSRTNSLRSNGRGVTPSSLSSELSDSERFPVSKHSRRGSSGSKPSSRPTSRLSRIRVNSGASGEEEKSGNKKSHRMSVASWVDSVTGVKEKKSKDTEAFEALDDDASVNNTTEHQTNGTGGTPKKSSLGRSSSISKSKENMSPTKVTPRILKPPSMQGKKVVRALYDFTGSTDELSFKSGNEIIVLNEVLDDWWMGELDGQRGLFPMSYTEGARLQNGKQDTSYKPGVSKGVNRYRKDYMTSDVDEDGELASKPMMIETPTYGTFNDAVSISSSLVDDEDDFRTQPMFFPQEVQQPFSDANHRFVVQHPTPLPPPSSQRPKRSILLPGDPAQESLINGTMDDDPSSPEITTSPTRKQPPPPPPRRPANRLPTSGPPVPRKPPLYTKTSPSESLLNVTTSPSPIGSVNHGYDRSPFDSAIELGATVVCDQFRQNPFKPEGMCSNCMEFHD